MFVLFDSPKMGYIMTREISLVCSFWRSTLSPTVPWQLKWVPPKLVFLIMGGRVDPGPPLPPEYFQKVRAKLKIHEDFCTATALWISLHFKKENPCRKVSQNSSLPVFDSDISQKFASFKRTFSVPHCHGFNQKSITHVLQRHSFNPKSMTQTCHITLVPSLVFSPKNCWYSEELYWSSPNPTYTNLSTSSRGWSWVSGWWDDQYGSSSKGM